MRETPLLDLTTPLKRRPAPGVVCHCWFGADRCSKCEAAASSSKAAKPTRSDPFANLPDDVVERIATMCGKDMPPFAISCSAVRRVVRPTMWRQAYEEACGAPVTCGEAMPPALWLACLLRDDF